MVCDLPSCNKLQVSIKETNYCEIVFIKPFSSTQQCWETDKPAIFSRKFKTTLKVHG